MKTLVENGQPIQSFIYKDPDQFEKNLIDAISLAAVKERKVALDKEYFQDPKKVRTDLVSYLNELRKTEMNESLTLGDLSTHSFIELYITCTNGEKVRGYTYVMRAGNALGFGEKKSIKFKQTLDYLKNLIGMDTEIKYPPMDNKYFENKYNIKRDLLGYFIELRRITDKKDSVKILLDLSSGNMHDIHSVCTNGEVVRGKVYLSRAAVALGLKKDAQKTALYEIFKRIGLPVPEYRKRLGSLETELEKEYFDNPIKVKGMLELILEEIKRDGEHRITSIDELSMGNTSNIHINLAEKPRLTAKNYIAKAAIHFGLVNNGEDPLSKGAEALKLLKIKSGIDVKEYAKMDAAYFAKEENIKTDLKAFIAAIQKKGKKISKPEDLLPNHFKTVEAVCNNKETVKGKTYLLRAAVALEIVEKYEDASGFNTDSLNGLLNRIKVEKKEYPEMNRKYFENIENLKQDLYSYLSATEETNPDNLKAKKMRSVEVVCANGEKVKGNTYLIRAGIELKLVNNRIEGANSITKICKALIQILKNRGSPAHIRTVRINHLG